MGKSEPYISEEIETLTEMYPTHFNTEIAEILGCNHRSVEWKIKQLGLTGRPHQSILLKQRNWKKCEDEHGMPIAELLYDLHWNHLLPVRNGIDKVLGFDSAVIGKWMDELNISKRTISEDNHRRYSTMTEEQIKAQTLAANEKVRVNGQPNNIGKIGWSAGLTKHNHPGLMTISLKQMGRKNPMYGVCGKSHYGWTGGKRYIKHKEWKVIRKKAKIRDNYTCQHCGISEDECLHVFGQLLQVHHIIPYRICKNTH